MKGFWPYFKLDMKMFFREPLFVIFTLLLPALMFYIFGTMYGGNSFSGNLNYVQRFLPSQISLILYAVGGFTLGLQIVTDKYSNAYKRLSITPINLPMIMISLFLRGLFIVAIAILELFVITFLMFNIDLGQIQWGIFLLSVFVSSWMFFSLGFMIASISAKPNHALTILLLLFYPMNMLSGSMFPTESLSKLLHLLSHLVPQTYTNQVLTSAWTGNFHNYNNILDIGIIVLFSIIFIYISKKTFRWSED